jgi:hypothetical protein
VGFGDAITPYHSQPAGVICPKAVKGEPQRPVSLCACFLHRSMSLEALELELLKFVRTGCNLIAAVGFA